MITASQSIARSFKGGGPGVILSLFGYEVLCCHALPFCFRVFAGLLSIVITSLEKERAGLCASRAFDCLFGTRQFLSFFSFSLCQGLTAACDCGALWIFILSNLYSDRVVI